MLPQERVSLTSACCHGDDSRSSIGLRSSHELQRESGSQREPGPQCSAPLRNSQPRVRRLKARRSCELAAGACSVGIWTFMPKCPLCVAAHVAFWTGLGLSFEQATLLRWSLLSVSGALLVYVIAKRKWPKQCCR
jgi:hypothetical protein